MYTCFNFLFFFILAEIIYNEIEAVSYEIFMWGDVVAINEVRYLGVSPH